jgi:F-box/leucine-rich repeat protein 2/20
LNQTRSVTCLLILVVVFFIDGLRDFSQNITTLTSLTCSYIKFIDGSDLSLIVDCFPLLEELDLSLPIPTRMLDNYESLLYGVKALSSKLFKLRKVNLTSHRYINDQTLFQLFKNCKLLEEVIIFNCNQITNASIVFALRERTTLRSLSFSNIFVQISHKKSLWTNLCQMQWIMIPLIFSQVCISSIFH